MTKRILLTFAVFLGVFIPVSSYAQPKTVTSSVAFQDPQGNVAANGILSLQLSVPAEISGGGQLAPSRVKITLDGTGKIPGGTTLWASDQLVPAGDTYYAQLQDSSGRYIAQFGNWLISGASPIDLSQQTPVVVGLSYPNPVILNPSGAQTGNINLAGSATITGALTAGSINKVILVDQQAGATADVKFANACTALPATGGVLDARGFGPGNQSIAATVSCGSSTQPVSFIFDPSTVYQPSTAALNMFKFSYSNYWTGLHIDATNQATYSGDAISNAAQGIQTATIDHTLVNLPSGSTGNCLHLNGTSASIFVDFSTFNDFTCFGGTASTPILLTNSGGGFVNANHFKGLRVYNAKWGIEYSQAGTASMYGNIFNDYEFEASSLVTALAAIHIDIGVGGGSVYGNEFQMNVSDLTAGNKSIINTDTTGHACGNLFSGTLTNGITETEGANCANPNLYFDTTGNLTWNSVGYQETLGTVRVKPEGSLSVGPDITIDNTKHINWLDSGGVARRHLTVDGSNIFYLDGDPTQKQIFVRPDASTLCTTFQSGGVVLSTSCSLTIGTGAAITTSGAGGTMAAVIASGTTTLTSGNIANATCQARVSSTATGAATTDGIEWAYATAPSVTTDALLTVSPDVSSAGNVGFTRCNTTATNPIASTGIVINWRVVR